MISLWHFYRIKQRLFHFAKWRGRWTFSSHLWLFRDCKIKKNSSKYTRLFYRDILIPKARFLWIFPEPYVKFDLEYKRRNRPCWCLQHPCRHMAVLSRLLHLQCRLLILAMEGDAVHETRQQRIDGGMIVVRISQMVIKDYLWRQQIRDFACHRDKYDRKDRGLNMKFHWRRRIYTLSRDELFLYNLPSAWSVSDKYQISDNLLFSVLIFVKSQDIKNL